MHKFCYDYIISNCGLEWDEKTSTFNDDDGLLYNMVRYVALRGKS